MVAQPASIERLRARTTNETKRLSLDTLSTIVDGLKAVRSMDSTIEVTGLNRQEILDVIAELGTWLIHAYGKADAKISYASNQAQQTLFQPGGTAVVIPLGFDRQKGHRRDVSKSIRAILVHAPDRAELSRYLDRKYPSDLAVLSGRDVHAIWQVACLNRLDELDEASPTTTFAAVMVEAYDLLDVSLSDAHSAATRIASGTPLTPEELTDALTKLSWLNQSRIQKVSALLERLGDQPSESASRTIERQLRMLATEIKARPWWIPTSIARLNEAQIQRLLEINGLALDPDARRTELNLRRRLSDAGLKKDLDLLIRDALLAISIGAEPVFWAAIDDRLNGDEGWRDHLDIVLEEALAN